VDGASLEHQNSQLTFRGADTKLLNQSAEWNVAANCAEAFIHLFNSFDELVSVGACGQHAQQPFHFAQQNDLVSQQGVIARLVCMHLGYLVTGHQFHRIRSYDCTTFACRETHKQVSHCGNALVRQHRHVCRTRVIMPNTPILVHLRIKSLIA
jgi:hypothetical protein